MTDASGAPESLSELEWLKRHLDEVIRVMQENSGLFKPLLAPTLRLDVNVLGGDALNYFYYEVLLAAFWRVLSNARGMHALLTARLRTPLLPVLRAQVEAFANLKYLAEPQDHAQPQNPELEPQFKALVYLAYDLLKRRELLTIQEREGMVELGAVKECDEQLDKLSQASAKGKRAVDLARQRERERRTWSGHTSTQLVTLAGSGFADGYTHLSIEDHAKFVGVYVTVEASGDTPSIKLADELSDQEAELRANEARALLHRAFRIMWSGFRGPPVSLQVPDPELWRPPSAR